MITATRIIILCFYCRCHTGWSAQWITGPEADALDGERAITQELPEKNTQETAMTTDAQPITSLPAWKALQAHHHAIQGLHLRELFRDDATRGERMAAEAAGIYLDYSKNRITDETLRLLIQLAGECRLHERIEAMFHGEKINVSEGRPVLHVARRAPEDAVLSVDGQNVVPDVHAVLNKMSDFCEQVRSGAWLGYTGKRIRNIINIGIGGSDLGPAMAFSALKYYSDRSLHFRFVSNVDAADFVEAVRDLDAAETCNGQLKQDTFLSRFFVEFPLKFQRGLVA
jgi:glucose-6-phosphate isomerase